MSRKTYLLVEWMEEDTAFPSYDVVNSNAVVSDETNLHVGKVIFVQTSNGNRARQALILRISDSKKQIKEHKLMLENQDHQVKNMLAMCMRTIKEMKTGSLLYNNETMSPSTAHTSPQIDDSSDDSDRQVENGTSIRTSNPALKSPARYKRSEMTELNGHGIITGTEQTVRTVESSKWLPARFSNAMPKLTFDQATQTETAHEPTEKIEQMEVILNHLYRQFLTLVGRLQLGCPEINIEVNNYTTLNRDEENFIEEAGEEQQPTEVNDFQPNAKLEVRRVSAQTTNNMEGLSSTVMDSDQMVPIGLGHATVPARLFNDINWSSYKTATRRLLQAIFPRKVLATHSLSGKPSPTFTNKPLKKCLDQKLVDDIIITVSEHCDVPKKLVRTCITLKCGDEAKLYNNRGRKRKNTSNNQNNIDSDNQENVAPSPAKSEGSFNDNK